MVLELDVHIFKYRGGIFILYAFCMLNVDILYIYSFST
jgi:hypothetical protein